MQFRVWPLDGGSKTEPPSDVPRSEITIFDSLLQRPVEPTLALGQSEAQQ